MATLYITSNADSGDGTLRGLIASASAGDIVEPDATVFPRGTVCEITLASGITVDKSLTIRGAHTKIRFDGGRLYDVRFIGDSSDCVCEDCEFINLKATYGPISHQAQSLVLNRCRVAGGEASWGCGVHLMPLAGPLFVANCVFVGNKATNRCSGLHFNGQAQDSVVLNCTFAGNVAPNSNWYNQEPVAKYNKTNNQNMKIPPVVDAETWTPDLWKEWDLHTSETTTYSAEDCETYAEYLKADIQGFLREVDSSGQIVDSPGAYANQPIDLYWVGKDANGDDVANPSFASEGWADTPTATTGSLVPSGGKNMYVGKSVDFIDTPPNGTLYVGDCVRVGLTNTAPVYCSLITGHGAEVVCSQTTSSTRLVPTKLYLGRDSYINAYVSNTNAGAMDCRADENVYIHSFYSQSSVPEATFYVLTLYGGASTAKRVAYSGTFKSDAVYVHLNEYYQFENTAFFTKKLVFQNALKDNWTNGTFTVFPTTSISGGNLTAAQADDFVVDLSSATSTVALNNLTGQVVRNNINGATLTGSARTSEVDLTKWTLGAGATLALVDGTMDFADGLINVYADKVLASLELVKATEIVFHNCFLGVADFAPGAYATTLSGSGYFATNDSTGVTTTGPKICAYGAGCSNFQATADRTMTVSFSVTKTDSSVAALLEKYDVETNAWTTVASDVSGASDSVSRSTTYRVFDGEKFLTATASVDGVVAYELAESFNLGYFSAGEVAVGYLQ